MGLVAGVFSLAAVTLRPFAGRIGDSRGRRILVLGGGTIAALSILGYSLSTSVLFIVLLRILNGVGEAFFFTGAATTIADIAPESRRGEAVSLFSLSLFVGLGVGPLIGEILLEESGYSAVWTAAGMMAALAVLVATRMPDLHPEKVVGAVPARFLHRKAVLPGIVLTLLVWGFAGFSSFIPLFALEIGMPGSRYVFLTYACVIVVIRSFGARIPDVFGARRIAATSGAFSAAGLALIAMTDTQWGLFVSAAVFGVGQALCLPALLSLAIAGTTPSERSSVIGSFTAFIDVAFGLGPLSLGFVAQVAGIRGVFWASAAMAVAGLAVLGTFLRAPGAEPPDVTSTAVKGGGPSAVCRPSGSRGSSTCRDPRSGPP